VRFIHPLARSGLYATASPAQRRELHGVLAEAVGTGDPDRRAWHRCQSVLGPDETIAQEMDAVAGRAAGRGAFFVAAQAAERAAELSPGEEAGAARLVFAGENAWWAGDATWANQLLDRAVQQDRRSGFAVRTRRLRGIIAARTGALDEARDMLLAAASEASEPAEAVACYAEAIYACLYLGDGAHALSAARATIALLSGVPPDVRVLGLLAAGMGQVLAGLDGSELLRAGVAELSGHRAFIAHPDDGAYLTLGPLFLRDSHNGRELVQQAIDDHRERAAVGSLPHLLFHIARDGATSDRWPQAEADYTEAIGIAREFGQSTELAASLAGLAWLEARQGRSEQARAHAAEATKLCIRHHIHLARVWAGFALADLEAGLREVGAAADSYAELERLLTELGIADIDVSPVPELVEAMIMSGASGGAAALAQEYDRRAEAKGRPWARARAARVRGLLADEDRMDHEFAAALALHALTPDDFEHARTQLAYGTRLRRVRRRVDARPALQAALNTFDRIGARPWATQAAQELAATGASVTRPGETPVSQLTARELQVALPLIRGRSTRQVAAALFLSPKTVEYHLRNIYTRFGISSRSELAALIGDDAQPGSPSGP
jgi:DNA-binding CsgD family transcriptional regulator